VAPAAGGATVRFGADLSAPANNGQYTCGNAFPFAFGATSCMAYGVTPTGYAPGSGVVQRVRVKTGDGPTGPMQIVVLRSFYQNNLQDPGHPNYFCCFLEKYGPVFTPRRNAVTAVTTALGVIEDPTPGPNDGNTVARGDFLGLSVLSGTVPIPVNVGGGGYTAFHAPAPIAPSNPPAPSPNPLGGGQGASPGYTLLMNADLEPIGAVAPTGTGGLTTSTASVPLICRLTTACKGTLTLRDRAAARRDATARAAKAKVLGSAAISIKAGKRKRVTVHLNTTGRKLARRASRLTVYGTAKIGKKTSTFTVALKK